MQNLIQLLSFLGAINGAVLSVFVFTRPDAKRGKQVLSAALVCLSLILFDNFLVASQLLDLIPHLTFATHPLYLAMWPLFYLYLRGLTGRPVERRLHRTLHFIPSLLVLILMMPFYAKSAADKIYYVEHLRGTEPHFSLIASYSLRFFQQLTYTIVILRSLVRHSKQIRQYFSDIEGVDLKWLKVLIILYLIIIALGSSRFFAVASSTPLPNVINEVTAVSLIGFVVIWLHAITYFAVFRPQLAAATEKMALDLAAHPADEAPAKQNEVPDSEITQADRAVAKSLEDVMEREKLYLEWDLTLGDLSARLQVSTHNLSRILNSHLGQNFFTFVNSYRIKEATVLLTRPEMRDAKILGIALDSGFKSKSTFNHHFKKVTGVTPSEYRSSQLTANLQPATAK